MSAKVVLLIDGEANMQEVVQACLKDLAGWKVISVASAREGIDKALAEQPDAIVLDIFASQVDGFVFLKALRANCTIQQIPVVLLIERIHCLSSQKIQQFKVAGIIAKPFNPVTLPHKITTILGWDTESSPLSGLP